MPKAYQISQYDQPLNVDGCLDLPDGTRIGIERAHLEEDTGKSTHVGGAGGRIHGSDVLADRLQPGRRAARRDRQPARHPHRRAGPRSTSPSCAAILRRHRRLRRQDGGGHRCASTPTSACTSPATPFGTRCEIKNVNSRPLARPGHRVRGAPPDRPDRGRRARCARRPATGTRTTAARTRCARKEDADDYRYFLEPDLVPLAPVAGVDRARSAPRCRCCRPPAAPRLAAATGVAGRRRGGRWSSSSAARTTTCSPSAPPAATSARALVHVKEAFAEQGAEPAVPAADLAALTTLEVERRAHGDAGQAGARRAGRQRWRRRRGDRRGQGLRGDGHRRARGAGRPGHRRQRRRRGTKFCGGEDKAMGALVGAVMKASARARPTAAAVTALLRAAGAAESASQLRRTRPANPPRFPQAAAGPPGRA